MGDSAIRSPESNESWSGLSFRLIAGDGAILVKRRFGSALNHLEAYLWKDLFTSLVDAHWKRILLLGAATYFAVWMGFALLYWIFMNDERDICPKSALKTFSDAFLLSIDAQTTIGFGNYAVDSECTSGIMILLLQCLVSILLDAAFMGLIFAKIARPQSRSSTLIFSRHACICEVDKAKYLMIRVADQRKNQLVEAHARLLMYYLDDASNRQEFPQESEPVVKSQGSQAHFSSPLLHIHMKQLPLMNSELFLALPCIIMHRIDHASPLHDAHAQQDLERRRIELVLLLEGATASTSQTMQARHSYLPSEIQWGREFAPCCHVEGTGPIHVNFDRVHATMPARTLLLRPDADKETSAVPVQVVKSGAAEGQGAAGEADSEGRTASAGGAAQLEFANAGRQSARKQGWEMQRPGA